MKTTRTTRTVADCRKIIAQYRSAGESIALVPTMGSLHEGHMSLIKAAHKVADRVVATIFVNPTQFGEAADLENYPRDEEGDVAKLSAHGTDLVLIPDVSEVYPKGNETIVETTRLANMLHGELRPGHFRGVTTVVARLFNFTQPDFACFGEKDYQQLQVIKRMVKDLAFPIEIIGVPTQRAESGLALSSRNQRLSAADLAAAPIINKALALAEAAKVHSVENFRKIIKDVIKSEPRAILRGLDIVEANTLDVIGNEQEKISCPIAIMISVEFSEILLIDQRVIEPEGV